MSQVYFYKQRIMAYYNYKLIEKIELQRKSSLSFFIFKRKTAFAEGGKK